MLPTRLPGRSAKTGFRSGSTTDVAGMRQVVGRSQLPCPWVAGWRGRSLVEWRIARMCVRFKSPGENAGSGRIRGNGDRQDACQGASAQSWSIRLRGYSYDQAGAYSVTVVTRRRVTRFGDVTDGEMQLNATGRLIAEGWELLETRYPYVRLGEYVVMPNILHGVIVVYGRNPGGSRTAFTGGDKERHVGATPRKPPGRLVGAFKTVATKRINLARGTPGQSLWQLNYIERLIRNEVELDRVRGHIANNPLKWELDSENPDAIANRRRPSRTQVI